MSGETELNAHDSKICHESACRLTKQLTMDCLHMEGGCCEQCMTPRLEVFIRRLTYLIRLAGFIGPTS